MAQLANLYKTAQDCINKSAKINPAAEIRLNLAACSYDAFVDTIHNINSISDEDLASLVSSSYYIVIENIMKRRDTVLARYLFGSTRYLTALLGALSSDRAAIDANIRYYLNKLIYDYFQLDSIDSVVEQLLLSIINIIDKDLVPNLIIVGMVSEDASHLAVCYYSANTDIALAVKRINKYLIYKFDDTIINEQKVVDIYLALFSNGFTLPFIGAMIDSYPKNVYDELTEDQKEIYGMIGNAVLDILEYMPIQSIINIIMKYSRDYYGYFKQQNPNLEPRLRLTSLSNDYPQINAAVSYIMKYTILIP